MKYKLKLINFHLYICKIKDYGIKGFVCNNCILRYTEECGDNFNDCNKLIGHNYYVFKKLF